MKNVKCQILNVKWFLFITFYILLLMAHTFAQDSTKVTDMAADSSLTDLGAMYYIESSTDKHITWGIIMAAIRDSIENNGFTITGTWAGNHTVSGVVTYSGANIHNGTNTFNDWTKLEVTLPRTTDTYYLGFSGLRWLYLNAKTIYTEKINIVDPAGSDSSDAAAWTYDGTNVTVNKPFHLTGNLILDSANVFTNTTYGTYVYVIANTGDSVLTLIADTCAAIRLSLPGSVTNMERIIFNPDAGNGLGEGTIIRIWHRAIGQTVFFEDESGDSGGGELSLEGDFTMGVYDYLELMYVFDGTDYKWMETSRSNN